MLKLARQQILLGQSVTTKADAIALLANKLTDAGLVEAGYVDGMLAREAQHATYLGSGIAIPHGTTDTRHLVKSTGVMVAQFPTASSGTRGRLPTSPSASPPSPTSTWGSCASSPTCWVTSRPQPSSRGDRRRDHHQYPDWRDCRQRGAIPDPGGLPGRRPGPVAAGAAARAKSAGWGDAAMVSALLASQPVHLGRASGWPVRKRPRPVGCWPPRAPR